MDKGDWKFRILEGLPGTGDLPVQFSATGMGTHSEGLVAEFWLESTGESWVGNFQRGLTHFDSILQHPNRHDVIVVAGGDAYVVNPETRTLQDNFGVVIETITPVPNQNYCIFGTSTGFEAVGPGGRVWRSDRIALDGIRSVHVEGSTLKGEAYNGFDKWLPFSVDVLTGASDAWWEP
jgi:hypothetical protein